MNGNQEVIIYSSEFPDGATYRIWYEHVVDRQFTINGKRYRGHSWIKDRRSVWLATPVLGLQPLHASCQVDPSTPLETLIQATITKVKALASEGYRPMAETVLFCRFDERTIYGWLMIPDWCGRGWDEEQFKRAMVTAAEEEED